MKFSTEVNELLVELYAIESIDHSVLLEDGLDYLCHNLIEIYTRTENPKSHDLIAKIIDKSGYSQFSQELIESQKNTVESEVGLLSDTDFMNLVPINGYFH